MTIEEMRDAGVTGGSLVDRNFSLMALVMHLIATNEQFQEVMPTHANLVIVPIDDPDLARHNLNLAGRAEDPLYVYVKLLSDSPGEVEILPWIRGQAVQSYRYEPVPTEHGQAGPALDATWT